MIEPPRWTQEQLEGDRLKAQSAFAKERMEESLEDYLEAFDKYQGHVEEFLEATVDLTQLDDTALDVLTDKRFLNAFRYLAAPPISADDLKVLAEAQSLTPTALKSNPNDVLRLVSVVRQVLDRRRFAWVKEGREPTEAERDAAVMASAALMAVRGTETARRSIGKTQQEQLVKDALKELGLAQVSTRKMDTISLAPAPGEFCGESILSGRKADLVVRLWDQRIMPIECKVSNSSTNSVKRLNNDAAVKASSWTKDLGVVHVVPTAVLSGVYKLRNLQDAQHRGLTLFWAHDLKPLTSWIASIKFQTEKT